MTSAAQTDLPSAPILSIDGARATIRLNRPRHHNRIEGGDIAPLCGMFSRIEAERRVRVLVLTATGRTFCAGFNLEELKPQAQERDGPAFGDMVDQLEGLRVPTICALNGNVYGGGTDLALACDFRIGVAGMEMLMPAGLIGVHYYYGGLRRYVTRLGIAAAKRLFLCGEKTHAAELLKIGYVDELVPAADLAARVDALALQLAANAPSALQGMKRALNRIAAAEGDRAEVERAARASMRSGELAEGLAAHAQKRKPVFGDD